MNRRRLRLRVLCEDALQQGLVERLADRWQIGPRQRHIDASPAARGSAARYVLDHFVDFVRTWRAHSHDENVGALVVIDGDERGLAHRRQELAERLRTAGEGPLDPTDPRFVIIVPCWHIETWIAWLYGHRPVDEHTRYKSADPHGRDVGRLIESGAYSPRLAAQAWTPPAADEASHVPSLTSARQELRRLGVAV